MSDRILITGAHILSQDPGQPDGVADVLIEDGKIARIGSEIEAGDAQIIDGSGQALLPGFVDTHRHTWQGAIRQTGIGWDFGNYRTFIQNTWGPNFTPERRLRRKPAGRRRGIGCGNHDPARRIAHPEQP